MPRTVLTAALALILPAVAAAGPIPVRLDTRVTASPWVAYGDWVSQSVTAVSPDQPIATDPAAPVLASLFRLTPPDLPADDPGNPYRTGATYYRDDYFDLTVRLTDVASGQSGEITYGGRLHADYTYAGNDNYSASAYIWLGSIAQSISLGGNLYTLSTPGGQYENTSGQFEVWVGNNAPVSTPEPGTLVLAALGLAPLVVRLRRRLPS